MSSCGAEEPSNNLVEWHGPERRPLARSVGQTEVIDVVGRQIKLEVMVNMKTANALRPHNPDVAAAVVGSGDRPMTTVTGTRCFKGSGSVDSTPLIVGKQFVCRRAVLVGFVAALLPSPTHAQKPPMPPRIGWLSAGSEPDPFLDGFRDGLRKLGYVEGQNVALRPSSYH